MPRLFSPVCWSCFAFHVTSIFAVPEQKSQGSSVGSSEVPVPSVFVCVTCVVCPAGTGPEASGVTSNDHASWLAFDVKRIRALTMSTSPSNIPWFTYFAPNVPCTGSASMTGWQFTVNAVASITPEISAFAPPTPTVSVTVAVAAPPVELDELEVSAPSSQAKATTAVVRAKARTGVRASERMALSRQNGHAREACEEKSGFLTFSEAVLNVKKMVMSLDRASRLRALGRCVRTALSRTVGSVALASAVVGCAEPPALVEPSVATSIDDAPLTPAYARLSDALCRSADDLGDESEGCANGPRPLHLDMFAREPLRPAPHVDTAPPTAAAVPAPALAPLESKPLVAMQVPGFEDAVVAIPAGVTARAPVVVAMHGHFDKPEQFCAAWAQIFQNRAFIVCPRGMFAPGSPWGDKRFTFVEANSAERELDAALAALHAAPFAAYVDAHKPVYVGFSLGAFMGVPLARRRGNDFSSMIFVEGNLDHMSRSMIEDYVGTGGHRMMLVCAEGKEALKTCSNHANRIVERLEGMGGEGTVVDAGRAGHSYEGQVAKAVSLAMPAFLEDDPRFASLLPTAAPAVVPASATVATKASADLQVSSKEAPGAQSGGVIAR